MHLWQKSDNGEERLDSVGDQSLLREVSAEQALIQHQYFVFLTGPKNAHEVDAL